GAADPRDAARDERPEDEADRAGDDRAAQPGERRPAQQEPEADADEDEGPDAPQIARYARAGETLLDGERHAAEGDQEHAPVQQAAVDAHGGSLPADMGRMAWYGRVIGGGDRSAAT